MEVVDAHKGIAVFHTHFRGVPAQSSATHIGVSATHAAGRFVAFLDDLFDEYQARARPDLGFVPPYTTIQVGILNGGTASNIIAQDCHVDWHFRTMPTDDPAEIESRAHECLEQLRETMQTRHADCDITTTSGARVPPLRPGQRFSGNRTRPSADRRQQHLPGIVRHRGRHLPGKQLRRRGVRSR